MKETMSYKKTHFSLSDLMRKFELTYPQAKRLVDTKVLIPDNLHTQAATLFHRSRLPEIRRAIQKHL